MRLALTAESTQLAIAKIGTGLLICTMLASAGSVYTATDLGTFIPNAINDSGQIDGG